MVAVGLLGTSTALVETPAPALGNHLKVLPFLIVAIKFSPKLSNDQSPPSIVALDVVLGVHHVELPHKPVPQPYPKADIKGPII